MKLRKIAALFAATAVVMGATASAALAADPTDVTVTGDSFSITNPAVANFPGVTLNGAAQTKYTTVDNFDVTDPRGTGDGWNVTVYGSPFAEWDSTLNTGAGGYVTSGKTLGTSALALGNLSVAKKDSTSSGLPTITTGNYTIDSTTSATTGAVKVASAASGDGMGSYTFSHSDQDAGTTGTQALKLSVRADAYAKTYRSDVTVSLVTGP